MVWLMALSMLTISFMYNGASAILLQGAKAGAAITAPAYDSEEFKRDLATSVQPIVADTVDQIDLAVQSVERDIAVCLQQQLTQAQQALSDASQLQAEQHLWATFTLRRAEFNLSLTSAATPAKF